ncbi:MAG: hypothetical protein ACT443_04095 [Gemmatimonadota bacterium]
MNRLFSRYLVTAVLLLPGILHGQVVRSGTTLNTSTNYSTCTGDKIQFTDFTVTTAANQNVTVQFKIRNLCSTTLNVPYKIADGSTIKSSGTKSVSGKQVASVQYTMPVAPGAHAIDAYLDDGNSLKEPSAYLANNGALNAISFIMAAPPMEIQILDAIKAKQYGAAFSAQLESPAPCVNVKAEEWSGTSTVSLQLVGPAPCGTAVYEMFRSFSLKNGWRIKALEVKRATDNLNDDWEWVTRPAEGSSNVYGRIRLKPDNVGPGIRAFHSVKYVIEGPKGTNPYH